MASPDPPGTTDSRLILKMGEPRFRAPEGITQVMVEFHRAPVKRIRIGRLEGKPFKIELRATVLDPPAVAGRTIVGFYNVGRNGLLGSASRLADAVRAMVGKEVPEGTNVDLPSIFAGRRAIVRIRRVRPKDPDHYDVMDKILQPVPGSRARVG